MNIEVIEARDLPEAWWMCMKRCLEVGHEYVIDRGSFEGQRRKEFDLAVIGVEQPGIRPLVPLTPQGISPPTTIEYVESYLSYWMTSHKEENEEYTYGEDLAPQIPEIIRMFREDGYNTNQTHMSVGNRDSIFLESSQCLRGIQCRIRCGKLHFIVYFRSWDLWGGFPANLAALQLMKEYMASEIGVDDGEMLCLSGGLHLYEHTWEIARAVVRMEQLDG